MSTLNSKVITATKWSTVTELIAKLISPISTMVLARLLTPDAFGILVTAQMVISFAELFTDAGFQKYLVQHEFPSDKAKYQSVNVAFWSNLIMSMLIWAVIIIWSNPIARVVGCEGHSLVISISSVCIPLAAFSSIQMALFKRDFDFKTLFSVRIIGICIPLVVTIPLALITRSYWSLVIGMIALNLSNAIILTIKSKWKPKLEYSFDRLKDMFSFSMWSMIESLALWLTTYVDIFIVGTLLDQYFLGLYRTSMTTVSQILGVITAATTPILFSSLSRLQNDENEFRKMFFKFQKIVSILIVPIGVGVYVFRETVVIILLGEQWLNVASFMGMWALTGVLSVLLSHYSSEVYRSKGKPKLSVLAQFLHLIVLWPTIIISIKYGFETLCEARALVRLQLILVNLIIMKFVIHMHISKMIANILPACIASMCMFIVLLFPESDTLWINLLYILIAALIYFAVILFFPGERNILLNIKKIISVR